MGVFEIFRAFLQRGQGAFIVEIRSIVPLTLAVTGLVPPTEALSGFSNPAVVTIWAVFILSGGLTRTGSANILGRQLLKVAGGREFVLVMVIMVVAGVFLYNHVRRIHQS